jgi:hypothetical protein
MQPEKTMSVDHRDERRRSQSARRDASDAEEAAKVAAFIRTRGITRCPTACAVATQATIDAADRAVLRARMAEDEARRISMLHGRGRRLPAGNGAGDGAGAADRASHPSVAPEIGAKGRAAHKQAADQFAAGLLPVIEAIRAGGVTGLTAIAEALNSRGIGAPRGGQWRGSAVRRLLDRATVRSPGGRGTTTRLRPPQP